MLSVYHLILIEKKRGKRENVTQNITWKLQHLTHISGHSSSLDPVKGGQGAVLRVGKLLAAGLALVLGGALDDLVQKRRRTSFELGFAM